MLAAFRPRNLLARAASPGRRARFPGRRARFPGRRTGARSACLRARHSGLRSAGRAPHLRRGARRGSPLADAGLAIFAKSGIVAAARCF